MAETSPCTCVVHLTARFLALLALIIVSSEFECEFNASCPPDGHELEVAPSAAVGTRIATATSPSIARVTRPASHRRTAAIRVTTGAPLVRPGTLVRRRSGTQTHPAGGRTPSLQSPFAAGP